MAGVMARALPIRSLLVSSPSRSSGPTSPQAQLRRCSIAKRANSKIKGILVKKRGAPLTALGDLADAEVAFPAPRAFAATLLTTAGLRQADVAFTPKYVDSHDSVYRAVALGKYPAGGGIMRTFKAVADEVGGQFERKRY